MAGISESGTFVAALHSDDYSALTEIGRSRRYPKGATLFSEGNRSDRVVILTKGRAKISRVTTDGREVLLAVRGAGDLLGEMSAFDERPHSATIVTLEDVDALVLTRQEFKAFLEAHPRAALTLLRMMSTRLRAADETRVDFLAHDAEGRVAKALVDLAERYGEATASGLRISLALSQEELAGWLGASRESVSKALQTLRGRGWIETHRRGITVSDLDALRKRSG